MKGKKGECIILTLLVVCGFLLRIYRLGAQSVWIDEAFTINAAETILKKGIPLLDTGFWYLGGILNSYITALFITVLSFIDKITASRLPSVIFGIATIYLVYKFGKRIANKEVGLIAAVFVAFSAWEIAWSRQARMYQQFQFLYILSLYFFYRFMEERKLKDLLIMLSATLLAALTHNLAIALPVIMLISILILMLKKDGILFDIVAQLKKLKANPSIYTTSILSAIIILGAVIWLMYMSLKKYQYVDVNYVKAYWYFIKNYHTLIFYTAVPGLIILWRKWRDGLLTLLSIIIPFIIIAQGVYLLHYRYLYMFFPFLCIASAQTVEWITGKKGRWKKMMLVLITLLFIILSKEFMIIPQSHYELEPLSPQPDFKAAYKFLKEEAKEEDVIIDAYPAVNKLYLDRVDYALKFSLSGREVDIVNKTHDVYTGVPYIDEEKLKKLKSCLVITDDLTIGRVNSSIKEYVTTKLQPTNPVVNNEMTDLRIWKC